MRKTTEKRIVQCTCCPRMTDSPRLGMCFACYQRARRDSALPAGASCSACGETDPIVLRVSPLGILCANDHARARSA